MIGSKTLAPGAKCILMQADLAREIGRSAAHLLQQVHYWTCNDKISGIIHDGKKWIINSYEDWSKDLGVVSKSTIQRALKKLKSLGLIEVNHLLKEQGNRTNCISLNYDQITILLEKNTKNSKTNDSLVLSSPHKVKMTLSSNQNDSIIYRNKITNKDNIITKSEEIAPNPSCRNKSEQVQQVDKIKNYDNLDEQKPIQSTVVQDMIAIWNKTFPKNHSKLTKELARNLNYAFQNKFDSNMKLWEHYCLTIESSRYLTGDKFNLYLDWAIKFKTLEDIKNGRYGVKEIIILEQLEQRVNEIYLEIDSLKEPEKCRQKRLYLLQKYGVAKYDCHLRNAQFYDINGEIYFIGKTNFLHSEIEKTYRYELHSGTQKHFEESLIQSMNKSDKSTDPNKKMADLELELLIINNSTTESELIKEKRRTLCHELGIQTYQQYFRNLRMIERDGEILITDRSGQKISISEKIRDLLNDSLFSQESLLSVDLKTNSTHQGTSNFYPSPTLYPGLMS